MNLKVKIYDEIKYSPESKKTAEVEYKNIKGLRLVTGEEAKELGETTDEASRDDFNEYVVLTAEDGSEMTFRNSYCDIFRI